MIALYEEGGSDAEVCKTLKLLPKDFNSKYKKDADFASLVDYGRLASKAWWLSVGRKAVKDKGKYDFGFWSANMEHRFDWKKSSTVNVNEEVERDPKELLNDFMAKRSGKGMTKLIAAAAAMEEGDGSVKYSTGS